MAQGEFRIRAVLAPAMLAAIAAVYWLDKGYGCAIVGALPQERLAAVARNAYRQLIEGAEKRV